ncbi:MAG: helicase HerA-like domain-containing protein [Myxococcota bacterium]
MDAWFGREVVAEGMSETGRVVPLDPDRLTRHAVCFGMTGSGKTGLCVTLLEELAMAGVPMIVIDPKGDMSNLALAFADHRPEDFAKWVDPAEADRAGQSVADFSAALSARWKKGLAGHGVDRARIDAFVKGARVTVYSPGSSAAIPVNVLGMLRAPVAGTSEDLEGLRDLVSGTVGSLLGLVGIDADPVKDPRHVVLSQIVESAWSRGEDLDLERLILKIVDPPFEKVGVFPVDLFFPRNDRMALAMQLNGVVASPGFQVWAQGETLDVDALLANDGRTPIRIFTLAHLDEAQRTFFCSMLLNQVVAWSRRQPGSSKLRALVYFDEVMGYLPPHPRNPPTKRPVLTLMKQARAVGVGTMLVTQNPVDVDYAAMSNAGTWIMGRLQTKQDRDRVLDGLSGATGDVDRKTLSAWLEALPPRTFLVKDVTVPAPFLVKSRWAISYLRGPMTRRELGQLEQDAPSAGSSAPGTSAPVSSAPSAAAAPVSGDPDLPTSPAPSPGGRPVSFLDPRVAFGARLSEYLESAEEEPRADGAIVWRAGLYARLHLKFDEGREFELVRDEHRLFFPITDHSIPDGVEPPFEPGDFLPSPPPGGRFHVLSTLIDEVRELQALEKRVKEEVLRGETEKTFRNRALKLEGRAGETVEQFQARARVAVQDLVDADVAKLKDKVDRAVERLEDKQRRLQRDIGQRESEVSSKQASEAMNIAETAYAWFTGRRRSVSTAMNKREQTRRASERLEQSKTELTEVERELYDLESDLETQVLAIENEKVKLLDQTEEIEVSLERADMTLDQFGIVWIPVTRPRVGS